MSEKPLIVVINDDPAFLEFIAAFLEEETNYQTIVWDDGVDAVVKLKKHQPALVILDVRLGDQAVGHEILVNMRHDAQLASMPVIICTADANFLEQNAELFNNLKAGVLEKPFDLDVLEQKVYAALEGSAAESDRADLVG